MAKLTHFFSRISTKWVTLAAFVVFMVFSIFTLPEENAKVNVYSKGMGGPDTSLFYTSKTLLHMAEIYGESGRSAYVKARWTFDLAFPVIYTVFLITSISFFSKRTRIKARWLNLAPLAAMVFDLAENISTSMVMSSYPKETTWQYLAPVFTPIKWLFVGGSFLVLVGLIVLWVIQKISRKNVDKQGFIP